MPPEISAAAPSTSAPSNDTSASNDSGSGGLGKTTTSKTSQSVKNAGGLDKVSVTKASPPAPADDFEEITVNGKPIKMTRQELRDRASLSYAAQQKFDEASKIRKEDEAKKARYKENRFQSFLDATEDLSPEQRRAEIEKFYTEQYIEPETLSPSEKRLKEVEAENKKYKDEREKADRQRKHEDDAKATNSERESMQTQIIDAIEKSGLPKSKHVVSRVAAYMRENLKNGWEAPMEMIVRQVKAERQQAYRDEIKDSSAEQMIELLGEDFVNKIRKFDLERLRTKRRGPQVESNEINQSSNKQDRDLGQTVNQRLRDIRLGKISY
jgi:hypothetical protein